MARVLAPIVAALALAACGGSPAAPVIPPAYVLTAGAYTLNIFPAPVEMNPGSVTVCLTIGGGAGTSIGIPVEARQQGAIWEVRPASGTLRMELAQVGLGYTGSLAGSYTSGGATVTIASPGTAAAVWAHTLGASSLSGRIDGDVRYTGSGGFTQSSCNANGWSLLPR